MRGISRILLLAAALTATAVTSASSWADVVIYRVPGLEMEFVLEGRAKVNPGRTLTFRHPLGTLYMGLEDVKVYEVRPRKAIAAGKIQAATSSRDVEQCLKAARWCLHNGLLEEFNKAMYAAYQINSQHPTVQRLAKMKIRMRQPLGSPAKQEQELREFSRHAGRMKFTRSPHFVLMHDTTDQAGRGRLTRAQQRLKLLESVYESFLMKFCLEGYDLQVPKEHLKVVLFSEYRNYLDFVNLLGPELKSAAGFYHRKKNISVFYDQGTHDSFQTLHQLNELLQQKKEQSKRNPTSATRDLVRFADTLQLLTDLSSENLDIEVVSHEATHHMAGNTGLMPGDAPVPVWAAEGLATYFESPKEAAWSGIGAVNEQRLDWYKRLERHTQYSNIEFLVTDKIFLLAANSDGTLHGYGQAWALTHFLMDRHFGKLMKWYQLIATKTEDRLKPDELLATFKEVFGDDLSPLELEWRAYMRNLKTDLELVLEDG